jgi:hypothetical protein
MQDSTRDEFASAAGRTASLGAGPQQRAQWRRHLSTPTWTCRPPCGCGSEQMSVKSFLCWHPCGFESARRSLLEFLLCRGIYARPICKLMEAILHLLPAALKPS